jgi:hypothetical protein
MRHPISGDGGTLVTAPPEVSFHRHFQNPARHPDDRLAYRGKQDLDDRALGPTLAAFLRDVQDALNEALRNEKQNVSEHVNHHPFHFDYIEGTVSNALAFRSGGYSFIGITMPLVHTLWDTCVELSKAQAVGAILEVPVSPEREEAILTTMFQTQLTFVVTHEYTHHVHGHLSQRAPGAAVFNEIISSSTEGSLDDQAFEMDADGYAVYHVLAHLIAGPRRKQAMELLCCDHLPADAQDEILFSSFVMAVGAFLYVLRPFSVNSSEVYTRTHPPQAARMSWIIRNATRWCDQNNRAALAAYMTLRKFQLLMNIVSVAIVGMTGGHNWGEQTAFLQSDAGSKYFKQLEARVKFHVQAL